MAKGKTSKNNPDNRKTDNDLRVKIQDLRDRAEKLQLQFRFHNGVFQVGDKLFAKDAKGGASYVEKYMEMLEKNG